MKQQTQKGFTIVELLVVMGIIAVLAMIVVFAFGSWRERTAKTEVRNALTAVSSAMKNERNFASTYPTTIPASYRTNTGVTVTYKSGTASTYCVDGASTSVSSVRMFVTEGAVVTEGSCP